MLIRTNSECDVPWWRRQLICHPVKINGTAMAIPLTQTKDKMFFLYDAWRRDWLDFARKEKWLRIFISKRLDRKSTRLNSSHKWISYAVFCLKKKIMKSNW